MLLKAAACCNKFANLNSSVNNLKQTITQFCHWLLGKYLAILFTMQTPQFLPLAACFITNACLLLQYETWVCAFNNTGMDAVFSVASGWLSQNTLWKCLIHLAHLDSLMSRCWRGKLKESLQQIERTQKSSGLSHRMGLVHPVLSPSSLSELS